MTSKQTKFLCELLTSGNKTEAMNKAGISRATAYKYMKEPEFIEELQKRKTEMLNDVCLKMQINIQIATDELVNIIKKSDVSDQVKINAIDCLFRNTKSITDQVDILGRIQKLEEGYNHESNNY